MSTCKCNNEKCPIKENCWRWKKPEHPYRQPWVAFQFDFETYTCENQIPVEDEPLEK